VAQRPRGRARNSRRCRALELFASCRDGATEAILLAHGFSIEHIIDLVRAGLATAKAARGPWRTDD